MIIKEHNDMGRLLKAKRDAEGLTIDQQAKKFGISSAVISRVGQGMICFSEKTVRKVLDCYKKEDPEFYDEFLITWVRQFQTQKQLPMPKNRKEALVAAYFLLGEKYVKDKIFV